MLEHRDFKTLPPDFESPLSHDLGPSQAEGGVALADLPLGAQLEVETSGHIYKLENRGDGDVHPHYCPTPALVKIHGSAAGPRMSRWGYIEPGTSMVFEHSTFGVIRTSRAHAVRELEPAEREAGNKQ